jgi:hypothetical protein
MDQVKVILKQLQKHHFWLFCVTVIITSIVGWWMARKSLSATYDQKRQAIVGKFSTMENLRGAESHPNASWKLGIDELTEKEKKTVGSTWEKIYNEQKQLLEWPKELGEKFLKFVDQSPPDAQFPPDLLDIYQRRIPDEYPRLLKIVGAEPATDSLRSADPKSPPAKSPAAAPPPADKNEPQVNWNSTSQKGLKELLEFQSRPTSAQVRQVQEDLWVYRAILRIIHAVNEGHFTPKIKQIVTMDIGKEASAQFAEGMASGHIEKVVAAASQSASVAAATPPPPPSAAEPAAAGAKSPNDGRYVNADGKPLPASSPVEQFKRMPIYLKLVVDQREIPKLLVECANSTLPIEVRQVRVNASGSGKSGGHSSTTTSSAPPRAAAGDAPDPFEVPIELHGIIYIYNKPNLTKAGAPGAGAPVPVSE